MQYLRKITHASQGYIPAKVTPDIGCRDGSVVQHDFTFLENFTSC